MIADPFPTEGSACLGGRGAPAGGQASAARAASAPGVGLRGSAPDRRAQGFPAVNAPGIYVTFQIHITGAHCAHPLALRRPRRRGAAR